MTTTTIDVHDLPARFSEMLALMATGVEVIVTEDGVAKASLAPPPVPAASQPRIPGLFAGRIEMSEDCDDPLPDEFWTDRR